MEIAKKRKSLDERNAKRRSAGATEFVNKKTARGKKSDPADRLAVEPEAGACPDVRLVANLLLSDLHGTLTASGTQSASGAVLLTHLAASAQLKHGSKRARACRARGV